MQTTYRKTVMITGANSGIGLATTKLFLERGYFVVAHYHKSDLELKSLKSSQLITFKADLASEADIQNMLKECSSSKLKIGILINNAGTFFRAPSFEEYPSSEFDRILKVNIKAPFLLCQHFMPLMKKEKWGRIINLSSSNVKHGGSPASIPYTISKSSLETLTRALSKEGAPHGVLVNAVRIGFTDTEFHTKNLAKNMQERLSFVKIGRMAAPQEMAQCLSFLASEEASYVTGAILDADGGE